MAEMQPASSDSHVSAGGSPKSKRGGASGTQPIPVKGGAASRRMTRSQVSACPSRAMRELHKPGAAHARNGLGSVHQLYWHLPLLVVWDLQCGMPWPSGGGGLS